MWLKTNIFLALSAWMTTFVCPLTARDVEDENQKFHAFVVPRFFDEAKKNTNWKVAFATAKDEQVVFMNISPKTNPRNEIGVEVHSFDQVILIVEGKGKAILEGKMSLVQSGDMIFIPAGTVHNVINLGQDKELKIISFYSDTDIPEGAVFKRKVDEERSSK